MSRTPRIHCPDLPDAGGAATLGEGASRHLLKVLRLGPGAGLRVFDGRGREHAARLTGGTVRAATVEVLEAREPAPESALSIRLLQGIGRGERMDLVIQKATELGVAAIVPVLSARSVVRLSGDRAARRRAHWQSVAIGACEQCGRATLPAIIEPCGLDEALAKLPADGPRLLPDPAAAAGLAGRPAPGPALTLLIGPEGGLDEAEIRAAGAAGFQRVRLGPRVLRTETAAIAAIALVQGLWGDLAV
jgi:16S rRNA (uracil1498-N3)-methyltransferase